MFKATKKRKLGQKAAKAKYTAATIKSSLEPNRVPGTDWYAWDFTVAIIGCGDKLPTDFDPDQLSQKFKVKKDLSKAELLREIELLLKNGDRPCDIAFDRNYGASLRMRDTAPVPPEELGKAELSKEKKAWWTLINRPDDAKGKTPDQLVAIYDKAMADQV